MMKSHGWSTIFLFCILTQKITACGQLQNDLGPRIAMGHNTHRWPWHVAIYHRFNETDFNYQCGGTLLSANIVLTAAHCVLVDPEDISVSLGRLRLNASESSASFKKVAKIVTHPDYISDNNENDIAMIILSIDAIFNNYVQPICLWNSEKTDLSEVIGKFGTVVGWGLTEKGETSDVLQEASLTVVGTFTCLRSNRDLYGRFLTDTNFCAGNRNDVGVCMGDSGGSMTFQENETFYIRGIVSVGANKLDRSTNSVTCDPTQYAVFTDVAQYLPWIRDTTNMRTRDPCVPSPCGGNAKCSERNGVAQCTSAQTVTLTTNRPISNRISARKCDEYSEFSYNKIYVLSASSPEKKVSNCPLTSSPFILGGTAARIREFPHMALIGFDKENDTISWDCGGTLISEQFVLSAAQCFNTRGQGPAKYVRLGEYDLDRLDDDTTIDLRIIERIPHPDYKYPIYYNDIGLLKLERRIELSGAIRPACLPQVSAIPTNTAIATGWGLVAWTENRSNVLLKVILEMFSQSECSRNYEPGRKLSDGIVEDTQFCAGSHTDEKDTCQGDAGGPLQIYHETHPCSYTVVGVVSFGKGCGRIGVPGVCSRVYAYLDWIERIVWPNE